MYRAVAYALAVLLLLRPVLGQRLDEIATLELTKHVEANGGKVGFYLGKECATCVRGAIASRDFKKGDVIAEVPYNMSIKLGVEGDYTAENAVKVLLQRFNDPTHNKTFEWFWKTQPDTDDVFTPDLYSKEHVLMLQSEQLENLVWAEQETTEDIYAGKEGHWLVPLSSLIGGDHVSLDQFKWYTALLVTRAFSFWKDAEGDKPRTYTVPLLDMINHSEEPNTAREEDDDGVFIIQRALKDIKKGEQLWQIYHDNMLHRTDMSLLLYGFVNNPDDDSPLLCAVDLPTFDPEDPYAPTPEDDSAHQPRGEWATADELSRLTEIWSSFPTTLKEDQDALAAGKYGDWRELMLLQYRILRKKALRNTIQSLAAELAEL